MVTTQKKIKTNNVLKARPKSASAAFFANPKVFVIIALLFLLLILFPLAKNYSRKALIEKEIEEINQEIIAFENQNYELQEMISYLQSDQFLEEQARLNMGMRKPGESVAVVQGDFSHLAAPEPVRPTPMPNWKKWYKYFFK